MEKQSHDMARYIILNIIVSQFQNEKLRNIIVRNMRNEETKSIFIRYGDM